MGAMPCPDANTLQALAAGDLGDEERDAFFVHADGCADCRELVAAIARQAIPDALSATIAASRDTTAGRVPAILPRGTRVARYEIDSLLGTGGLGVVYAAQDPELGRRVALKLLRAHTGGGEGQERLVREARALARIAHPNVVAVHDAGTWNDRVYLAMDLVAGTDLRGWLVRRPRRWPEVVDLFVQAGRGLAAAHAAGLVHRDFKPENVLVGDDGRALVTDFGLARHAGDDGDAGGMPEGSSDPLETPLTHAGSIVGTPAYMAPEQHEGEAADARSDQFAFCAALHEALYGARPFSGKTYAELRAAVRAGRVPPPPRGASVPASLRRLVLRGLAARPEDRWPSMAALLTALGRDRTRLPRRIAAFAGALLAVLVTALAADGVLRERNAALARTAFAAARGEIERALAARYETFSALAEVTTMLPILREVAAARDEAAFGLGSADADARRLATLHASLRDADWDAWAPVVLRGAFAVADARGRLLYTTSEPDRMGNEVRRLAAVNDAYEAHGSGGGTQVIAVDDEAVTASGLAPRVTVGRLVIVFARAAVLAGVPQAMFIQIIDARRLLAELSSGRDIVLGLVAPDGTSDGDLPADLMAAGQRGNGTLIEEPPWLIQVHQLPGLQRGAPVATLVMAHHAGVGLAGLFSGARPTLAVASLICLVILVICISLLRR